MATRNRPMAGASVTLDSVPPQFGNEAVHEPLPIRKISIAKAKEVMTGDHDPTTGSPFEHDRRIMTEAGCCLTIA
jgi:hypothetical protein